MPKYRSVLTVSLLALSAAAARPVAAQVSNCYSDVLRDCAAAMDGARWYERWALGVVCSGMLVGCAA